MNYHKAKQETTQLAQIIRDYFINRPSGEDYTLDEPDISDYSNGQSPIVDSILNEMESGFYVECGALDGEKGSNTLFFERTRRWKGLLIEANPENFHDLQSKHRKAYTMNACLNPHPYPSQVQFNKAYNRGRVIHKESLKWFENQQIGLHITVVQCFPLYAVLKALNRTRIDYLSLDIEGDELGVLRTIPWDKVDIRVMSVEYAHGKYRDLRIYMEMVGYEVVEKIQRPDGGASDLILRKR